MASSPTQPAGCRETNNPGALMTCFPAQFGPHTYKDIEIEKLTHLAGAPEVALGPALSRAGTAPPGRQPLGPSRRAPQAQRHTPSSRPVTRGAPRQVRDHFRRPSVQCSHRDGGLTARCQPVSRDIAPSGLCRFNKESKRTCSTG